MKINIDYDLPRYNLNNIISKLSLSHKDKNTHNHECGYNWLYRETGIVPAITKVFQISTSTILVEIMSLSLNMKKCNASQLTIYVTVQGEQFFGGIAEPDTTLQSRTCSWYFTFDIGLDSHSKTVDIDIDSVVSEYTINAYLLTWNAHVTFDNYKCQERRNKIWHSMIVNLNTQPNDREHDERNDNENGNKLNHFSVDDNVDDDDDEHGDFIYHDIAISSKLPIDPDSQEFTFRDPIFSCCEYCTRLGPILCGYWISHVWDETNKFQQCITLYDDKFFAFLVEKLTNHFKFSTVESFIKQIGKNEIKTLMIDDLIYKHNIDIFKLMLEKRTKQDYQVEMYLQSTLQVVCFSCVFHFWLSEYQYKLSLLGNDVA